MNLRVNNAVADNIKHYRKKLGLTAPQLADKLDVSDTAIYNWETGKRIPRMGYIEKMANLFHINVSDLMEVVDWSNKKKASELPKNIVKIDKNKISYIPLIGTIAMGTPITAEQNIERYIPEFFLDDIPTDELIALKCKGHSMEPTIPNGAIAIIHLQPEVEDDEIAAVLVDDNSEATLKRVKHMGKNILLMPENKNYDPIMLDKDHSGRIIGKLIKYEVTTDKK